MGDSTTAVPPGWYPVRTSRDSSAWDGTQWTEHVQAPYSAAAATAALKAPEGTKTGTLSIWLIVLLPLLGLSTLFLIDWADYIDSVMASSLSGAYADTPIPRPVHVAGLPPQQSSSFAIYGLTVVFAVLECAS